MPTGYTAYVQDGATFEEFVWRCARQFGALVTMRDEPADASVPEAFTPSKFHVERIAGLEEEITRLEALTPDEAAAHAAEARKAAEQSNADRVAKVAEIRRKYEAMLERVRAWVPPSDDHIGLRNFMIDQLVESIEFDCQPYEEELPTLDGGVWLSRQLENAHRSLDYHHKEQAKELERVGRRNRWVRQLRESVPVAAA